MTSSLCCPIRCRHHAAPAPADRRRSALQNSAGKLDLSYGIFRTFDRHSISSIDCLERAERPDIRFSEVVSRACMRSPSGSRLTSVRNFVAALKARPFSSPLPRRGNRSPLDPLSKNQRCQHPRHEPRSRRGRQAASISPWLPPT